MKLLNSCRIVLVRTKFAGNLGAAARIMRNMGLTDLILVAPEADPADRQARQLSTHGEALLDQARIVPELADAIGDCVMVVATSARTGGPFRRQSVGPPEQIMPHLVQAAATGPVALVFGPESSGLTNEEVTCCHYLVHIPADSGYPALNLGQAVAICTYELRRAWLSRSGKQASETPPVSWAELDGMFSRLRRALEEVHFLYGENADSLMHALRHLLARAQPTQMEVDVLNGLARQIRWYVEHNHAEP